jgi:hypothetical protein
LHRPAKQQQFLGQGGLAAAPGLTRNCLTVNVVICFPAGSS